MSRRDAHPRVRGPRLTRGKKPRSNPARPSVEPSTFAWVEPLADVDPIVVERKVETSVIVERKVEVPVEKKIYVDRAVPTEGAPRVVEKERVVEKKVVVEKPLIVEKQVFLERNSDKKNSKAATAAGSGDSGKNKSSKPKTIIIGRGPGLGAKLARIAPKPTPVLAGASALLIALVGVALISPSSDRATAQRSDAALITESAGEATDAVIGNNNSSVEDKAKGSERDPFAANDYEAPKPPAKKPATKNKADAKKQSAANAKTRATAPAASKTSFYAANLVAYSSYTPWSKLKKRAGGWVDFDGKPTIKVIAVGANSVELFVVTDVEVLENKSRGIEYDKPVRQVTLTKGGFVRFADYRDIQGDDVTYTIRFGGSEKVTVEGAK